MTPTLYALLTEIQTSVFQGAMLWVLVYYELKRKHTAEKPKGTFAILGWIYYLRIELMFLAILSPNAFKLVTSLWSQ